MTSAVTKAMIESYALMILVMGTFFVYFCGMVWAFCNPKLSGEEDEEEEEEEEKQSSEHRDECWICAPNLPGQDHRRACAHRMEVGGLTQTTYINFWDDTDSLLSDCAAFCREDHRIEGINNLIGQSTSWTA